MPTPAVGTALSCLLGDDVEGFARDAWGRAPRLTRAAARSGASDLITTADLDALLSEHALRTPFVRVTKDGVVTAPGRYTGGAGAGASIADQVRDAAIAELLADGQTVVLQGLHRTHPGIRSFTSRLAAELGCPVQANAYVTPADQRGFDAHYDVHDVFVVQVEGEKHWQVHEPVHRDPLPDEPWTQHRDAVRAATQEPPVLDVVLHPGDVLYLPRGTVHGARSTDDLSVHLTLGVHPVTVHQVARAALATIAADPAVRTSWPLGVTFDEAAATEAVRKALATVQAAFDALDAQQLARAVTTEVASATRPDPVAPLAHARLIGNLGEGTEVVRRPGLLCVLGEDAVHLPDATIAIGTTERAAAAHLLDGDTHAAGRLPGLAPAAAVDLSRRLARAGAIVAAPG